jgi:threonine/homoserine/homoserine lactone efflux protein
VGQAIGQVMAFAAGVALSPIPIIAVVLMLATPKARSNGLAFLGGWMLGLAAVGTIVLFAANGAGASESGAPATWVSVLKIVLGVVLLLVAVRQWRGRPRGDSEPDLPGWMKRIDTLTAPRAAGIAVVLAAVNPKNLLLTVGAAAAIAQTGVSTGDQAIALAVFVVLGALGPGIPVAIYFLMRDRATATLENMRAWMVRENAMIMAVICLIIAAKLIGDAITGIAS